jgi:hypothetical protein
MGTCTGQGFATTRQTKIFLLSPLDWGIHDAAEFGWGNSRFTVLVPIDIGL